MIKTFILYSLIVIPCIILPGFAAGESVKSDAMFMNKMNQLKSNILPLDLSKKPIHTPLEDAYFHYYGLDFKGIDHFFGFFVSGGYTLSAHIFVPETRKGTIILMHGYFDHTGTLKNLIKHCLDRSFAVAVYDMPGHGLSAGKRLWINDFSEYTLIFDDFARLVQEQFHDLCCLIAHSTGCAVGYEYLYHHPDRSIFKKIIFLSPLVRHAYWNISTAHYHLAKPFVENLPRKIRENSSDAGYIEKVINDPLQERYIPIKWLEALYSWNTKIQDYNKLAVKVLIIQGKGDTVVDWEYNIPFLVKKLEPVTVKWIDHARHQLVNEEVSIRTEVFEAISAYLE